MYLENEYMPLLLFNVFILVVYTLTSAYILIVFKFKMDRSAILTIFIFLLNFLIFCYDWGYKNRFNHYKDGN